MENRITKLFGIKYPIISGGMVWCSGWELASAVSNAGGLGIIGAGSMSSELLADHICKCQKATDKPFGVNIPLAFHGSDGHIDVVIKAGVKVVFTSAGSANKWTAKLQSFGIIVVHVVASTVFAIKVQSAGVDAVVVEGFEAGGHNGKEETTTMVLAPTVKKAITIPLIVAGGISSGESVAAAFALGAEGVQIGTRFALSTESSASSEFKKKCIGLPEGSTMLCMKSAGSVRMVRNAVYTRINEAEYAGASKEQLQEIAGKGRAKMGIFECDLDEGFVEIGQVCSDVRSEQSVAEIFDDIITGYNDAIAKLVTM